MMNMQEKIIFEVSKEKKKDLSGFLKTNGFSGKYVESIEIHFDNNKEVSFVKPILKF